MTRQLPIAIVERGADNEDLARAYRTDIITIEEENKIRAAHIARAADQD